MSYLNPGRGKFWRRRREENPNEVQRLRAKRHRQRQRRRALQKAGRKAARRGR